MSDLRVATADTRTRILDAVEAIVQRAGVPALTLEAVARDAGMSKGGLLYHFASKEALLIGLLRRLADFVEAEMDSFIEAAPPGPHHLARAWLNWMMDCPLSQAHDRYDRAAAVFLAAHHHDPALLDPVRAVLQRQKAALLASDTPPGPALAILTAGDGLFMAHVFGTWSITPEERSALHASLEGMLV
ncbi:TetR family transcriptional regulator [Humitalea rosea]|uniref:TetR family transcriptional regulator n=1 Tax=Humitalea rosea TaxID=990373 RepID=A0A2W7IK94_9PROT|nr:TetR/AcrR family transcriptional regulator [Humitalea rosea]PZW47122.1 TetR family transcriptional regulator [Humitalea rosea]